MSEPTRKRKGPTVSLISGTNGKPIRERAGKAFNCHHCDARFAKGDPYVAIPQRNGAHTDHLRVCDACFAPILQKTAADVAALGSL